MWCEVKCLKAEPLVLLSQKCQDPCRDVTRGRGEEGIGEFLRERGCRDLEGKSPGTWPGAWEGGSKPALGLDHCEPAAVPRGSEGGTRTLHLPGRCPGKSPGPVSSYVPVGLILLHLPRVGKKALKRSSFPHVSGI